MQRIYLYSHVKRTFVPLLLALILSPLGSAFGGDTNVHTDKGDITGITRVAVRKDGKITIYSGTSRRIMDPAKLPPGFLASWGVDTNAVASKVQVADENSFESALADGGFRIVDGVVYDLRKHQTGWIEFPKVSVLVKLSEDEAILDTMPDRTNAANLIHVVHFPRIRSYGDQDQFRFLGKFMGKIMLKVKGLGQAMIDTYDPGRAAEREELPDAILKDGAASAPLVTRGGVSSVDSLPQVERLLGMGTAFFITGDGYLVTADHVVRGVHKVRVKNGEKYFDAKVVKADQKVDLAVLKIDGSSFTALPLSGKKDPELSADVFTIGFPNPDVQGFEPKYTDGKISSLSGLRDDPLRFQITVPIQPGNSGGPLINRYGAVDGVIVSSLSATYMLAESGSLPENVNYAVKTSTLRDFLSPIHELDGKLLTQSGSRNHADVMKRAQEAVVMVLGYK
jgi:S1-C subfamily serine protease